MRKLNKQNIEDILALTPMQKGMLFHYLQDPQSDHYFEQLSLEISGEIDRKLFEKAWNFVIDANEMLRALFRWEKVENPIQVVLREYHLQPGYYDLLREEGSEKKKQLDDIKVRDRKEKFDLREVPFRITLCRVEKVKYAMIISNHHILYDGWSNGIILREFFKAYNDLFNGRKLVKPDKTKFKEFVRWNQEQDKNAQEKFWKEYFGDFEAAGEISPKRRKSNANELKNTDTHRDMGTCLLRFDRGMTHMLEDLAKKLQVTLAALFYSAWGFLLQKYSNTADVLFGTTVSGRTAGITSIGNMVGLFINTLPLRIQTRPGKKIQDVLYETNETLQIRKEYESSALVRIKECIGPDGRGELFNSVVVIENYPLESVSKEASSQLSITSVSMLETTHYDLTIGIATPDESHIEIAFIYHKGAFDKESIVKLSDGFKRIVKGIITNVEKEIVEIDILPEEEKRKILYDFNHTDVDYPEDKTIHRLFAEQVSAAPDHVALIGQSADKKHFALCALCCALTYRELNEKSDRLAYLLQTKGVRPDTIVGLMVERSLEMLIGILGILKAGGAYLPIDPGCPGNRIGYMLADSNANMLVTFSPTGTLAGKGRKVGNWDGERIYLQDTQNPPPREGGGYQPATWCSNPQLAYVIYTSGTTGRPKGVMIEHRNVASYLYAFSREFEISVSDTVLQQASYTFDAFVEEVYPALLRGGKLAVPTKEQIMDIPLLLELIARHRINIIDCTPMLLNELNRAVLQGTGLEMLRSVHTFISGGDVLKPGGVDHLSKIGKVYNTYGPTECTVCATYYHYNQTLVSAVVPIGKPIYGYRVVVLDRNHRLQFIGAGGEIYIGGEGVARGYLNNPGLTSEKFINNDQCPITNDRLYQTGDLGRWLPDGTIEFLGRGDHQVKIRGFRIELAEIETQLLAHDGVKETVVTAGKYGGGSGAEREIDDDCLCAYIVPTSPGAVEGPGLRSHLLRELPDYMSPAYFVMLDGIPVNPSGKVDIKALPPPGISRLKEYAPPRDEIERKLAAIWSEVLGRDAWQASQLQAPIGIDDNFFERGGHSLKATTMSAKVHKELNLKLPTAEIFRTPTIRDLAKYIKRTAKEKYDSIEHVEEKEYYALSSIQKRLYVIQQMNPKSTAYNMSGVYVLEGNIDKEKLAETFRRLIKRHESLRTSFVMLDPEPVQMIHRENYKFRMANYTQIPDFESPITGIIEKFLRPFDLSRAPLLRAGLLYTKGNPGEKYILMVDMHHIISDGVSHGILMQDFISLVQGEKLPAPGFQYKDYAQWQNRGKENENFKRQEAYWLQEFTGEIKVLDLPTDFPGPITPDFAGNTLGFQLGGQEFEKLKALALEEKSTPYIILLSLFNIFLAKISGQEEIVVGTPTAGRRHADLEHIIGMFVNTLVLRNYPAGEKVVEEFIKELRYRTLTAFENQDYPLENLVEKIGKSRDTGKNPLFDVMFSLQDMDAAVLRVPGLKLSSYEFENKVSRFDLALQAFASEDRLAITFEYRSQLFKKETIERFTRYFKKIISNAINDKKRKIKDMEIISGKEKQQLLFDINDTRTDYPGEKSLPELFEEQVEQIPGFIAAAGHSEKFPPPLEDNTLITYKQLNEGANQLAGFLREKGVRADAIVGMMMERSIEMIIAILGILKAGGAYLPIDPDYPAARINYMLSDSQAKILLTTKNITKAINFDKEMIVLNSAGCPFNSHHSSFITHHSKSLAYIIYTSGSTGKPRGVMTQHRNVVRLVKNSNYIDFTGDDRLLMTGTVCFDVTTFEIWGPLLNGSSLHLAAEEVILDAARLKTTIVKNKISLLHLIPQLFNQLIHQDQEIFAGLKYFLVGGDLVRPQGVNRLRNTYKHLKILHMYGPTENTTFSTFFPVDKDYEITIPIGKPISNSGVYILDKYGKPQPKGLAGELCVGGDGVARGYLNNPRLTFERFIDYKLQITGAGTIYKTGDLAQWLPDGNIKFLGRIDRQVKIRGMRIELGEIESRLLKHQDIKEAVVLAKSRHSRGDESGDKYLCAYIVINGNLKKTLHTGKLREYMSPALPGYMIPSYFVQVAGLPLTANGKIDLEALPAPGVEGARGDHTSPGNPLEEKLAEIWSDVLFGRDSNLRHAPPGIDDNFFEQGGHSLKAALLTARVHKALDAAVPLAMIFKRPTIRGLAEYIKGTGKTPPSPYRPIQPLEKKEYYPLSSAQKRMFLVNRLNKGDDTSYNTPRGMLVEGRLSKQRIEAVFKLLIKRHETLRTSIEILAETLVQRVHAPGDINFEISDDDPADLHHFVRSFDLSRPPLLRAGLAGLSSGKHLLMFDMHHIISDDTSMAILIDEFIHLYQGVEPPGLKIQYKDFAVWQNRLQQTAPVKKQVEYWLDVFSPPGEIPVLDMPTSYPRPANQSVEGDYIEFALSEDLSKKIQQMALANGATLHMVILSIYNILLAKYSGQEDIVVGTPTAGRPHPDLDHLIGMFVNTLAMRNYPRGEKTFKQFLEEVKSNALKAYENQDYQFDDLVDRLGIERDPGRHPLFDTMLAVQNIDRVWERQLFGQAIDDLNFKPYKSGDKTAPFDIALQAWESNEKIAFTWRYCTKLFNREMLGALTRHFINVAGEVTADPGIKINRVKMFSSKEEEKLFVQPSKKELQDMEINFELPDGINT